ncbi:MAG: peptidylprolyl isomerase [Rhodovarius sp.]|nr:peptidylprolyl isomerase [Rhodovarius sp.]MCX7931483.1 peptidylprolyl isomerase [Rhodovarius sp.]MDW8314957.1 peptidylprolyl isomerase [Rhodovarius sp.]
MTENDAAAAQASAGQDRENLILMEIAHGMVTIALRPDLAPRHVERIKVLSRRGFYDGTPFHRVIEGFMAQGGDPTGTGMGGSDLPDLPAEFSPPSRARFLRGTCGMARTQNPNSANSQFFIMFAPAPFLDGQYTIWGQVIAGMEAVDRIARGQGPNGIVRNPDRILRMRVAADVPA